MDRVTNEISTTALFEAFFSCQKILRNALDLRELHLTRQQFYTLMALAGPKKLTMGQVAESIVVSREQATRIVAPLVEEGYIERCSDDSNRKLVLVQLTGRGQEFIDREKDYVRKQLEDRFEHLTQVETERFLKCVSQLKEILEKI